MLEVAGRAGIGGVHLQHVAVAEVPHQLARFQDRQRAFHALRVEEMDIHALPVSLVASLAAGACAPNKISITLADTMMMPPTASRQPNG